MKKTRFKPPGGVLTIIDFCRDKCDPLTGKTMEKSTTYRLEDCACKKVAESSRPCTCSCPAPKTRTSCNSETGVLQTIKEVYSLADCQCNLATQKSEKTTDCPSGVILSRQVGPCQLDEESGDSYREVSWISGEREGCKCVQRRHTKRELCGKFIKLQFITFPVRVLNSNA